MAKLNFGEIKATFTNYMNESENLSAKEMFGKFMNTIKESKVLKAEFEVYKNLDSKYIPNENLAIKYIDENVALLCSITMRENFIKENEKIQKLVEGLEIKVSERKKELYNHIDTLLTESLADNKSTDVDKLHESFSFLLEHIKTNKPKLVESTDSEIDLKGVPQEFLIKKAIEKFNLKFSSLTESDRSIFKSIVSDNQNLKQTVFENLKDQTLESLNRLIDNSSPEPMKEKINESITKITSMSFNKDTYSNDVISLNELKSSLTQQ
jgi:hypothetical protein